MLTPEAYNTPPICSAQGLLRVAVEPKSRNITWHAGRVTRQQRCDVLGHHPALIWLTGLSGSGKSSIALAVEEALVAKGVHSYRLDGDNARFGLNKDLGFSPEDRSENIRRIGEVAKLFVDAGSIVVTAFISPYRADRAMVRASQAHPSDFIEVHVSCPLDICEQRDPKGLYKRARAGEIKNFTGISAPYEAPENPEFVVHTGDQTLEESVSSLLNFLATRGLIPD